MSDTKHTPIPWSIKYEGAPEIWTVDRTKPIADAAWDEDYYPDDGLPTQAEVEANAEFICKACNHHDELVGMVECCIAAMDGEWGGDSQIVKRMTEQLAKVRDSQ